VKPTHKHFNPGFRSSCHSEGGKPEAKGAVNLKSPLMKILNQVNADLSRYSLANLMLLSYIEKNCTLERLQYIAHLNKEYHG
jgi:hypothetical protein